MGLVTFDLSFRLMDLVGLCFESFPIVHPMADGSMLAAAKLLEPLAERVGHLEHVTQAVFFQCWRLEAICDHLRALGLKSTFQDVETFFFGEAVLYTA